MTLRVRDAESGDLGSLVYLGSRMLAETVAEFPPLDVEHMRGKLDTAVAMPEVFLIALVEDDGVPVGMVTAVAGDYAFSPERRSASDLLFVVPERRGSTAAHRLVKRYLDWSAGLDAKFANIGLSTGVSPESTGRFLERMKFQPMGMMYRRRLR